MMKRLLGLALLLLSLASLASAQRIVVSPQAIVVNPRPGFDVQVWLDRDTSGNSTPVYDIGEEIRISVRPAETSYIYVFDVKPSGEVQQIFPNRFDSQNRVSAGQTITLPPSGARYVFNIAPPRGLSKVIAFASRTELDTRQLASFRNQTDLFAVSNIGEEGFAQSFAIIVNPIPQESWVTDTALYSVGQAAQPRWGTLALQSNPSGADVYVDGVFAGITPLNFSASPGRHDVRFELAGYDSFSTSTSVGAGQTQNVSANLQAQVRAGTIAFTSVPSGADVYVDGRYVGTTPTGAIRFEEGSYTARFEAIGYQSTSINFRAVAGRDLTVDAGLIANMASVVVQANVGGAAVFLDGRQVGSIPNGTGRLVLRDVAVGTHELVVIAPGYSTYVTTFSAQAGREVQLNVRQSRF